MTAQDDTRFVGSIPEIYDRLLVPLIFEPYASNLAQRLTKEKPRTLLEIATGTGVVTRALTSALPDTVDAKSRAPSPLEPAIAYCQGTPLRNEIEARDAFAHS